MRRRPAEGPGTARGIAGLLWAATTWALVAFLLVLAVLVVDGRLQKYQIMSVLSGSMVPALDIGDLVVARVVTPDELQAGELATFREPGTGKLVTHRVQSILWRGEVADVVTRGDSNEVGENWSVTPTDHVGEVTLVVPRAGYLVGFLTTPAGHLGLAGLAAVLGVWILVVLWRPPRDDAPVREPRRRLPLPAASPG